MLEKSKPGPAQLPTTASVMSAKAPGNQAARSNEIIDDPVVDVQPLQWHCNSINAAGTAAVCFIGHLKEQRRIATRYDKLATSFVGFVLLGCIRIWARFVHRA